MQRVRAISTSLGDTINPVPPWQLHITLFVAGFPRVLPRLDDDISRRLLLAQAKNLAAFTSECLPAQLDVGSANSFATAAFLEVHDSEGILARLRQVLAKPLLAEGRSEVRFAPYVPHVTIGTYRQDVPVAPLRSLLTPWRRICPLPLTITGVELVDFDTRVEQGPLRTLLALPFASGQIAPTGRGAGWRSYPWPPKR